MTVTDLTTNENAAATNSTTKSSSSATKVGPEMRAELYRNLCDVIAEAEHQAVPGVAVCYVIISTSSLLWTVITLVATGLVGFGLMTPYWLTAEPGSRSQFRSNGTNGVRGAVSIGIFSECTGQRRPSMADILAALSGATSGDVTTVGFVSTSGCDSTFSLTTTSGNVAGEDGHFGDPTTFGFVTTSGFGTSFAFACTSGYATTSGDVTGECGTFVSGFDMPDDAFPDAWKSALILLTAGTILLTFSDFSALISLCVQSFFGKSIFTVTGLLQSIAGTRSWKN